MTLTNCSVSDRRFFVFVPTERFDLYCVCICKSNQEQLENEKVNRQHRLCDVRLVESAGVNVQGPRSQFGVSKTGIPIQSVFQVK